MAERRTFQHRSARPPEVPPYLLPVGAAVVHFVKELQTAGEVAASIAAETSGEGLHSAA
jgi:hypothetical protein